MIVICDGSALDLDRINAYKPDGKGVYCRFDAATHKIKSVSEKDFGKFVQAEDQAIVFFSDIAFKMLFDLSVKAKLESVKYIINEALRSKAVDGEGNLRLFRPSRKRPLGALLHEHDIKNISLPSDSKLIAHNLRALSEYDMVNMLCTRAPYYSSEYMEACMDMIEFIGRYIYLGKATKSLMHLHKAICELLCTLDLPDFKTFVEDFYALLDKIPAKKYGKAAIEYIRAVDAREPEEPELDESEKSEETGSEMTEEELDANREAKLDEMFSHKLKAITGMDITGMDETYAAGYCEEFYLKDLENADSQGFLEQLIIARANGGAAPIDLLSDAISREHSKDNPASMLRRNMNDIRNNIQETLNSANISADSPIPVIAEQADNTPDPEGEPEGEAVSLNADPDLDSGVEPKDFEDEFPDEPIPDDDGDSEEAPDEGFGDEDIPDDIDEE